MAVNVGQSCGQGMNSLPAACFKTPPLSASAKSHWHPAPTRHLRTSHGAGRTHYTAV